MARKITLSLLLLLSFTSLYCGEVSLENARKAAKSFFSERVFGSQGQYPCEFQFREELTKTEGGRVLYYIFNLDPKGWIIVSSEDAAMPVLAYSFEGKYSEDRSPESCHAWMKQYEDQIIHAKETRLVQHPETKAAWDYYLGLHGDRKSQVSGPIAGVDPLITSDWNQDAPYNAMCPADAAGPGGHAYAGCVPTCMGQLMYYFRWPDTGTGTYSYTDPTYGTLSANFDTIYDWDGMSNTATGGNEAIALLLSHLGISCDLVYGPTGSGMYNHKAAYSLRTYFKYSPETRYVFRDSTGMDWDSILIVNLDNKIPLYYAGWSVPNINGHAFVCDGYQDTSYFHFNFGWSGQNNGYFYTDNLTPGGNNFNLAQEVIINAVPDTVNYTYPPYCSGATTLSSLQGSIDDGSRHRHNYLPNSTCSWTIDPQKGVDSVSSVTLTFNRFETSTGDNLDVYDGADASAPLLGSFTGNDLPPVITSTGNKLHLEFTSGDTPGPGFFGTYKTTAPVWCGGVQTITADTAELSDGSFDFNYHNSQNCKWKVMPQNGQPLTLYFRSFDTEANTDFLKIYDLTTQTLIAEISGHYDSTGLPEPVTIESGQAFLVFTSNSSVTGKGWEIYYPKSTIGIPGTESGPDIKVFPNPASDNVSVSFSLKNNENAAISICDTRGSLVYSTTLKASAGTNTITIPVSNFAAGFYTIELKATQATVHKKLIIQ